MTKNRVIALIFDQETFILSPHYDRFQIGLDIRDGDNRYVIEGHDKEHFHPDDFTTIFSETQQGFVPNLPEGEYNFVARITHNQNEFKIVFSLYNTTTSTTEKEIVFDAEDYIEQYSEEFNKAGKALDKNQCYHFEHRFSTNYLKQFFGEIIEGNSDFWTQIYGDLDMATTPLNLQMGIKNGTAFDIPIVSVDGLTGKEIKQSPTLP